MHFRVSMDAEEKDLVKRLNEGDGAAFETVYDKHYVSLCHIAYGYVGDVFTAESIVGDAIFHLWEIHSSVIISTSVMAYLSRSVRNRCLNYLEMNGKRKVLMSEIEEDGFLISGDHPLGILLEQELDSQIKAAISQMPDECRCVFMKSRFESKKYEEIAQEMGISLNTVKYHMKNAFSFLRKRLEKYLFLLMVLIGLLK